MHLVEINYDNARPIDGYGPGFFRVAGQVMTAPLIVTADDTAPWSGYEDSAALLALAGQVDVLFIGTGPTLTPLPKDLRDRLDDAGIGTEIMTSDAACRTFNVLLSEGRRVAAALLSV
ncbi:Mth938-like domain-containing protein [Pseudooceanicola algae]|uniref:Mth938-like domain-containing protein n=1 Tax=Pseudooceanicola algae TaxID=1537215 RepID=A0A418SC48_9RHOB|nr:Mth938-like domain-containing protein [Pseudooceanicola algae]QPM89970.1 hypothetical protein PSAL_012010 [Pseudooceanicola algae]